MKLLLIVLSALAIFDAEAVPHIQQMSVFLSDFECNEGPQWWCQSQEHAELCGKTKYCNQNVWNKQSNFVNNGQFCGICLKAVKIVQDQLETNETQIDVKTFLEGICSFIQSTKIQKLCLKFVDELSPELIEALISKLKPETVCKDVWACENNFALTETHIEDEANLSSDFDNSLPTKIVYDNDISFEPTGHNVGDFDCVICKKLAKKVKDYVSHADESDFKTLLQRICETPNDYKTKCLKWIDQNADFIYDFIKNALDTDFVCTSLEICRKQSDDLNIFGLQMVPSNNRLEKVEPKHSYKITPSPTHQDNECEICKEIAMQLRQIFASVSEADFKNALEDVCKTIDWYESECLKLVDEYADTIYEELANGIDPKAICGILGFCSTEKDVPRTLEIRVNQLMSVFSDENEQIIQTKHTSKMNDDDLECVICQNLIEAVENQVEKDMPKEKIEKILKEACLITHSKKLKTKCGKFTDLIVDIIAKHAKPWVICKSIKLCYSKNNRISKLKKQNSPCSNDETATMCKKRRAIEKFLSVFAF